MCWFKHAWDWLGFCRRRATFACIGQCNKAITRQCKSSWKRPMRPTSSSDKRYATPLSAWPQVAVFLSFWLRVMPRKKCQGSRNFGHEDGSVPRFLVLLAAACPFLLPSKREMRRYSLEKCGIFTRTEFKRNAALCHKNWVQEKCSTLSRGLSPFSGILPGHAEHVQSWRQGQ